MILHHFFERILCDRLRFFLCRLGAFASRSCDLVGSSVSRGCFERVCFNELGVQRSERYFDFGALRVFLLDFEIRWDLGSPSCWLGSFCRRDLGVQRSAWDFLRGGVPMDFPGPTSGRLIVGSTSDGCLDTENLEFQFYLWTPIKRHHVGSRGGRTPRRSASDKPLDKENPES